MERADWFIVKRESMSPTWVIRAMREIGQEPTEYEGKTINLQTQEMFDALPIGTALISISGKRVVKGVDDIDNDTRGGYLAFGLLDG